MHVLWMTTTSLVNEEAFEADQSPIHPHSSVRSPVLAERWTGLSLSRLRLVCSREIIVWMASSIRIGLWTRSPPNLIDTPPAVQHTSVAIGEIDC